MLKIIFWTAIALILYTYFIYPLLLWIMRAGTQHSIKPQKDYFPSVSLVISVYNEEKVIDSKVKNCLMLNYPKDKVEIIFGSDGSTDKTESIIAKYSAKGITLHSFQHRRGKVNVLNALIPLAKGEIVVFSDANTLFKKDTIKNLVRNFRNQDVGCVCGELVFKDSKESEIKNLEGFYWRYEQFLKRKEGARGALLGANGGIYAIRKELFTPLPPDVLVEDFVMPMKILEKGYKVVYEADAIAYEEASKKIVQEMERRIRIGAGDFQALSLTWRVLNPLSGFPAFAYFSHKVVRWCVPFLLIIVFLTNMALLGDINYSFVFILQCAFYLIAIAGRILSRSNVRLKLLGLPYYFVSMNLALFLGFVKLCTHSQSVTWSRTER